MATEEMSRMPATGPLLRRAITGSVPTHTRRGDRLPAVHLLVTGVRVSPDHLDRYSRLCGFRLTDTLPPTYPHVLAFPLSLDLMTRPAFPFPVLGLVHLQNTVAQVRPVGRSERLDLAVRAENLREHDRGRTVDVVITATVDGAQVWCERSRYLRRQGGGKTDTGMAATKTASDGADAFVPAPAFAARWQIDSSVGKEYARLSGDRNPIHTSLLAARAFGFPRRIAHGMWTKARCLAALEGRLPDKYTVDVTFKLPVLLPATVAFSSARQTDHGWRFALHDVRSGRPHVMGLVSP